jgi:hypothetical protein
MACLIERISLNYEGRLLTFAGFLAAGLRLEIHSPNLPAQDRSLMSPSASLFSIERAASALCRATRRDNSAGPEVVLVCFPTARSLASRRAPEWP